MFGWTFLGDPVCAGERSEWRHRMSENHRLGITRATTGVITRQGIESEIDKITVPTLILVGDEDVAVPPAPLPAPARAYRWIAPGDHPSRWSYFDYRGAYGGKQCHHKLS